MAQAPGGMIMPKISYASTMIVEDHLRKCLAKTSAQPFNKNKDKLLPRAQHSPFGDFPAKSMPKKPLGVTPIENTIKHEQSIAATGTSKSYLSMHSAS